MNNEGRGLILHREPSVRVSGQLVRYGAIHEQRLAAHGPAPRLVSGATKRRCERVDARATRVRPDRERSALGQGGGRLLRLVPELSAELPNGPGGEPRPDGDLLIGGSAGQRRRLAREAAENGVREPTLTRGREGDRLRDRGVRRNSSKEELIRPKAEHGAGRPRRRMKRSVREPFEEPIQGHQPP